MGQGEIALKLHQTPVLTYFYLEVLGNQCKKQPVLVQRSSSDVQRQFRRRRVHYNFIYCCAILKTLLQRKMPILLTEFSRA